jgi:hypothetical protein
MSTPRPHPANPPTPKQLRYLRDLADRTGQSFAYPITVAEASREIERLRKLRRTPAADRRRERLEVSRDMAEHRGDASRIDQEVELEGYAGTARWSTFVTDEAEEEAREREMQQRRRSWR